MSYAFKHLNRSGDNFNTKDVSDVLFCSIFSNGPFSASFSLCSSFQQLSVHIMLLSKSMAMYLTLEDSKNSIINYFVFKLVNFIDS